MNFLPLSALIACTLATSACASKQTTLEKKSFSFHVSGDPGKPVPNAELTVNGQRVAMTDAQGVGLVGLRRSRR